MAVISKLNLNDKEITKYDNSIISNINLNGDDYHFAKEKELESVICREAVSEPLIDMQISGNSVQSNLPSEYQEYTSITDTNGVVYTRNGSIYPAKRNSDGVFGLYNTTINIFQTEV